ncbi:hypothetical protein JCM10908_001380 [Rhodotorula pacifica]|uniref:uncharacterized protein n=1 Tax=Rhodotorula pacifica TaxID=1495444 RepID=UPI0031806780
MAQPRRAKHRQPSGASAQSRTTLHTASGRLRSALDHAFRATYICQLGLALLHLWVMPFHAARKNRSPAVRRSLDAFGRKLDAACAEVDNILSRRNESPTRKLHFIADLFSNRFAFPTISHEFGWSTSASERAAADNTQRFALAIINAPNPDTVPLPLSFLGARRRVYDSWGRQMLYLISLVACGIRRSTHTISTDWHKNQHTIDAAEPGLSERLEAWRQARKKQLTQRAYDSLSDTDAAAWFTWLDRLTVAVRRAAETNGIDTPEERLRRAAHMVLAETDEKVGKEVRTIMSETAPRATSMLFGPEMHRLEQNINLHGNQTGHNERSVNHFDPVQSATSNAFSAYQPPEPDHPPNADAHAYNFAPTSSLGNQHQYLPGHPFTFQQTPVDTFSASSSFSHNDPTPSNSLASNAHMPPLGAVSDAPLAVTHQLLPAGGTSAGAQYPPAASNTEPWPLHTDWSIDDPYAHPGGGLRMQQPVGLSHQWWYHGPHDEQAFGHYPRIARRIARRVYGIDPDQWASKTR